VKGEVGWQMRAGRSAGRCRLLLGRLHDWRRGSRLLTAVEVL
jgi:hypothetical protein